MLLNCLDEIATARRLKAALLPDQRAEKNLIQSHHADQNSARQVDKHVHESFDTDSHAELMTRGPAKSNFATRARR